MIKNPEIPNKSILIPNIAVTLIIRLIEVRGIMHNLDNKNRDTKIFLLRIIKQSKIHSLKHLANIHSPQWNNIKNKSKSRREHIPHQARKTYSINITRDLHKQNQKTTNYNKRSNWQNRKLKTFWISTWRTKSMEGRLDQTHIEQSDK